jgi:hypothetical protein
VQITSDNATQDFTGDHASQYGVLSSDMRAMAEQRFKVLTVFLVSSGIVATVAKDRPSVLLGVGGLLAALLCLAWDVATVRWWGILLRQCQKLEARGMSSGHMIAGYQLYPTFRVKPSHVIAAVYLLGGFAWLVFAVVSFPSLW